MTDAAAAVARRYDRFAREEGPGRSELYTGWAASVAAHPAACAVIARLPADRRQPPLVFAVARLLGAQAVDDLPAWMVARADGLIAATVERGLQTNEALRCAALLPALSLIEGPIALLELGASAGLCLFPDRYRYRYRSPDGDVVAIDPPAAPRGAPVLECAVRGEGMPPLAVPEIVWRAGVDRHPLHARDAADRLWLRTLVWPGEAGREERLRLALDVAAADPPFILAADAAAGCAELAVLAPTGATLVIATPGLLAHVPPPHRDEVVAVARAAGHWVTIDHRSLHPEWLGDDGFALALDGEVLASVDPLGGWLEWLPGTRSGAG